MYQIVSLLLVLWCCIGCAALRSAEVSTKHARPRLEVSEDFAVDFSLPDLTGRKQSLEDYTGKLVLLHFWSTWCMSCYEELHQMKALYEDLKPSGLEILAVSIDESPGLVQQYVRKHKIPFPVLLDISKKVQSRFQASGLPSTVLIGKSGKLLSIQIEGVSRGPVLSGAQDWEDPEVKEAIESYLSR